MIYDVPHHNGDIRAIAVLGNTVFFGGSFHGVDAARRASLAAVDRETGALLPWQGRVKPPEELPSSSSIEALSVREGVLYVGGMLYSDNHSYPEVGYGVVGVDPETGRPVGHSAATGAWLTCFAVVSGERALLGGTFASAGGLRRAGGCAINLESGRATRWNPVASRGAVLALATRGDRVYLGGEFKSVGRTSFPYIARVDSGAGAVDPIPTWPNAPVLAMKFVGEDLFIGGAFNLVRQGPLPSVGLSRKGLAALSPDLQVRGWNCDLVGAVREIDDDGQNLYIGGSFTDVRGLPRGRVARVDPVTGAVAPWNPGANGIVYDVHITGSRIYLAGAFSTVGGQNRPGLAAVEPSSGEVLPWNPKANGDVRKVVEVGEQVYLGGHETVFMPEVPETWLAAVKRDDGGSIGWDHPIRSYVYTLDMIDGSLLAGGEYPQLFPLEQPNLAYVPLPGEQPALVDVEGRTSMGLRILGLWPIPARTHMDLRFELATSTRVTLEVYDAAGRRRAAGIGELWPAGTHSTRLDLEGLSPGVYWLRISSSGASMNRRIVIVGK